MSVLIFGLLFVASVSQARVASVSEEVWADGVVNLHACFAQAFQDGKTKQAAGVNIDNMDAFIANSCTTQMFDAENNHGVTLEEMARLLYNVQQEK